MNELESAHSEVLRIAQLNSLLSGGGTDDQSVKLAHGLVKIGQAVWVAGPDGRDFSRLVRDLGVPFQPTPPEGPMKLRFILGAARLLRRERSQIVHGHHGRDLWPTILAARISGVRPKIVLTRHLAKSPSSWPSRRFLLSQCDAVIAVSQFVAKVLGEGDYEPQSPDPERRARPPLLGDRSKIHVVYGGIDTSRFRPFDATAQRANWGLAPENFAFGVVGAYDRPRGKGQREFLRAAAQIHQQIPNARFLLVGRGQLKDTLEQDIETLGLRGKARLTPYCHDMPGAMNALDCLVHPPVGTEAFSMVVLEALACGRPVIASRLDGIPEALAAGNLGQLVEPDSVPQLAAAMLDWASKPRLDSQDRQSLHDRLSAGFSLEAMARNMLALYRRLLEPSKTRSK